MAPIYQAIDTAPDGKFFAAIVLMWSAFAFINRMSRRT